MKILNLAVFAFLTFCSSSCIFQGTDITASYKKCTPDEVVSLVKVEDMTALVDVKAVAKPPSPKAKTKSSVVDLSDHGQAEFIKFAANDPEKVLKMMETLGGEFGKKEERSYIDNRTFVRDIIISLNQVPLARDGSRIEVVRIDLANTDNKIEFTNWTGITTQYREVGVGTLTSAQSRSLTFTPEVSLTGDVIGVSGGGLDMSSSSGKSVDVIQKYAPLFVIMEPSKSEFSIIRRADPVEDISGNTVIQVVGKISANPIIELFYSVKGHIDKNGQILNDPSKVRIIDREYYSHSISASDTKIWLRYSFIYRKVLNGGKTPEEYDDKISREKGVVPESTSFNLLNESDLKRNFWCLRDNQNVLELKGNRTDTQASSGNMYFKSYKEAENFLAWLVKNNSVTSLDGFDLKIGSDTISPLAIDQLSVSIISL